MYAFCYHISGEIKLCVYRDCLQWAVETAEPIEMPIGTLSRVNPRNQVSDGVQIPMGRDNFDGEGHAMTYPTTFCRELCYQSR